MAKVTPKPVKVFTREAPCTKVDIHLCFADVDGAYRPRAVVEARGEIGLNAVKYYKKKGFVEEYELDGITWWEVTEEGEVYLREGLARHLELHPDQRNRVEGGSKKTTRRKRIKV